MKVKAKKLILCQTRCFSTINSIVYAGEYNQEMPQSQIADQQKKDHRQPLSQHRAKRLALFIKRI